MSAPSELQLDAAYSVCTNIARSKARNFYFGFLALPRERRRSLSAVYAFMRYADDVADDPAKPADERRALLRQFLDRYHAAAAGAATDEPIFLALRDAQQRHGIPMELLDLLVRGTAMDLEEEAAPTRPGELLAPYKSFEELYEYCYHVASVVGLVCIHVFGFHGEEAQLHAERLGVAFQLTNILRDVKEDAAMGRIYLPTEDLANFGVTPQQLAVGAPMDKIRPLLKMEAQRARDLYKALDLLLPMVEDESQPALWALAEIYRGILDCVEKREYDVYTERARVTTLAKVAILGRGLLKRLA